MKKKFRTGFILSILIPLIPGAIILLAPLPGSSYRFFPHNQDIHSFVVTDQQAGGSSISYKHEVLPHRNEITFSIGDGIPYPYVQLGFVAGENKMIDLSSFDSVKIRLSSTLSRLVIKLICISPSLESNFKEEDFFSNKIMSEYELLLKPGMRDYRFRFDDFTIKDWWYAEQKFSLGYEFDFRQVFNFQIGHHYPVSGKKMEKTVVEEIIFYKDLWVFRLTGIILIILYYLLFPVRVFIKEKKRRLYEALKNRNGLPYKLFSFINENYANPHISTALVAAETRISKKRIEKLVMKFFGISFQEYVNRLRINEAVRLLGETNLRISEIASLLGFSNLSRFDRVFKKHQGKSPRQSRRFTRLIK